MLRAGAVLSSVRLWSVLAFALGIAPLWLSSREMWDGLIGVHALEHRDADALRAWVLDSNWYLTWLLLQAGDFLDRSLGLPLWVACKALISALALGIAWQAAWLARELFSIPPRLARWAVPLVLAFPLWYVFFSFTCMLGHLSCVWLALFGYRCYLHRSLGRSLAGLVLIGMAVQLASCGPFLIALEAGRWWLGRPTGHDSRLRAAALVLTCIAVYAATRLLWPPLGLYAGYNAVRLPWSAASWLAYLRSAAMFASWGLLLLPAALLLAAGRSRDASDSGARSGGRAGIVMAALAIVACLPYVLVGIGSPLLSPTRGSGSVSAALASIGAGPWPVTAWYGGWGARHLLLVMVPLVWAILWMAQRTRLAQLALVASCALFAGFAAAGHWAKLHRIAQEATVSRLLSALPPPPAGRLDLLPGPSVNYVNVLYETNYLLDKAYGRSTWAAFMVPDHPDVRAWAELDRATALAQPRREPVRTQQLMKDYDWSRVCKTTARITIPALSASDVLWRAEWAPAQLPAAVLGQVSSDCGDAAAPWR